MSVGGSFQSSRINSHRVAKSLYSRKGASAVQIWHNIISIARAATAQLKELTMPAQHTARTAKQLQHCGEDDDGN